MQQDFYRTFYDDPAQAASFSEAEPSALQLIQHWK